MSDPLFAGLRVIDCGSYIAAPSATTILADFGADVIKVEPPGVGDALRKIHQLPGMPRSEHDYASLMDNRNKRLAVNLTRPEGQAVLHRLVESADIFVTNYPLPLRDRLRIDHPTLSAMNPRLIYGSFTGYGELGADSAKPGFDTSAYWARSGLMDQVRPDADAPPARSIPGLGDHPSGTALYAGLVTALYQRERTGKGELVQSSLLTNALWANGFFGTAALNDAEFTPRPRREEGLNALTMHYRCGDGSWILFAVLNEDRDWPDLANALGRSDLITDPRFVTRADRHRNSRELLAIFDEVLATADQSFWTDRLRQTSVVFEIVATPEQMARDEQAELNDYFVSFVDDPDRRAINSPFRLDGSAKVEHRMPPGIGQHTAAILAEVGYEKNDIESLRDSGAIG